MLPAGSRAVVSLDERQPGAFAFKGDSPRCRLHAGQSRGWTPPSCCVAWRTRLGVGSVVLWRPDQAVGVPPGAPPLFIAVAADERAVGYQGSIDLFNAWRKAGLPAELHVFQTGQHGFGVKGGGADHYMDRLEEWLKVNGWLTKASK